MVEELDVAGLGNALVDALVRVEDEALLTELALRRGHMHPVDHNAWNGAFGRVQELGVELQSGGSCANTIATLGLLGARVRFCGHVGADEMGRLYADRLTWACGGHALSVAHDGAHTGKVLSLITGADAERTMLTDLGAATLLPSIDHFVPMLERARILHTEGYLMLDDGMRRRAFEAMRVTKAAGGLISVDMADPFVVETSREVMWDVVRTYADIVFLNAEEAERLTGKSPAAAVDELGGIVRTAVVKLGSRGSVVVHEGRLYGAGVTRVRAVDTTGAGDAFAGGFLFGLVRGWDAGRAAELAAQVAALTVAQMGAVCRDREALDRLVVAAEGSRR